MVTVDDRPVAEVIREAIARHVDERRKDEAFREGLRERIERARGC